MGLDTSVAPSGQLSWGETIGNAYGYLARAHRNGIGICARSARAFAIQFLPAPFTSTSAGPLSPSLTFVSSSDHPFLFYAPHLHHLVSFTWTKRLSTKCRSKGHRHPFE